MSKPTRRGSRAPARSRREQVIDVATHRLNRFGVRDTAIKDLAEALGLTRAALYHYIEDREDLVFQVYRRSCELLARALGEAAAEETSALGTVQGFVRRALSPDRPEIAALTELGLLRSGERETVQGLYEGTVSRLTSILEAGVSSGELRPMDAGVVARTVISMIHGAPQVLSFPADLGIIDPSAYIATLNDVLALGWCADRARTVDPKPLDLEPLRARQVSAFDRQALTASRREQILVAASLLFNRKGIDGTSMDEVAAALRVTKRTLYQHVGDKRALVTACLERGHGMFHSLEAQTVSRIEDGEPLMDALVALLQGSAQLWLYEDIAPLRQNLGFYALSANDQQSFLHYIRRLGEIMMGRLEALSAAGEVRSVDFEYLMPIIPTAAAWLSKGDRRDSEDRRRAITVEAVKVHRIGLKAI